MFTRILLNLLIFSSILFLPWWMTLFVVLVLLFALEAPEVLVWGLFIDVLYSVPLVLFFHFTFVFTFLFFVLFLFTKYLKKRLVFYPTS